MPFDMLLQGKKNAYLKNTANKHRVINVTLTELMKPGCNAFYSEDDAPIATTELNILKYLITEISDTKDLLVLLL